MNFSESKEVVNQFIEALSHGTKKNGIARYESWLRNSKERIYDAFKIFLAHSINNKKLPSDIFDKYLEASSYIKDFIVDENAAIVDEMHALGDIKKIMKFGEKSKIFFEYRSLSNDKYFEVVAFLDKVKKLNPSDKYYCKNIYELAGLKYYTEYEEDFIK